ncbi:SH3 [Geosmithia morbida]|uniref:SH3 n=1 Tax=Geosmithia morbida TaxID=1094350 RepID=A0A9P4YML8_9HYPO|nr:SH3 [Geosmithia morbida]KAF4119753.1 SH3 [Geosmithia morbida]
MTRPSIVRADTIDLQNHDATSAKAHQRSHLGIHQAETLREVAHESAEEQGRSPRISWVDDPAQNRNPDDDSDDGNDLAAGVRSKMSSRQQQQQQEQDEIEDALAVAQNGGISSSDEGDTDGDDLDDDMLDRISSSPSIEDEDIDFEFVYALHTFVATVEGQANATKGDTMVLLDDSNSYWWLVRVVKDSSIGYLPAEHIETPTERLARLNKHRNVDLSATMLGDQSPSQKQQKATGFKSIRKRWKSVTFAEPTYVDYNNGDFSSDDDGDDDEILFGSAAAATAASTAAADDNQSQSQSQQAAGDDGAVVGPLKTRPGKVSRPGDPARDSDSSSTSSDDDDDSARPSRSRNGTVRNTDSFFKDDSVETKKITLTPNLLRDENEAAAAAAAAATSRPSTDSSKDGRHSSQSQSQRPSLESKMDKELMSDRDSNRKRDKEARDKKDRDKKPSAIRSFFSRKDKKRSGSGSGADVDADAAADAAAAADSKHSLDAVSEPRDSEDTTSTPQSPEKSGVNRSPSKLQKVQPRIEPSPTRKNSLQSKRPPQQPDLAHYADADNSSRTNNVSYVPPASMRIVDPETQETREVSSSQYQQQQQQQKQSSSPFSSSGGGGGMSGGVGALASSLMPRSLDPSTSSSSSPAAKPQKTVKAKTRMELDESDTGSDADPTPSAAAASATAVSDEPQLPGAFPEDDQQTPTQPRPQPRQSTHHSHPSGDGPDSRTAVQGDISPVSSSQPPGLTGDYSPSPVGSPSPPEEGDSSSSSSSEEDHVVTPVAPTAGATATGAAARTMPTPLQTSVTQGVAGTVRSGSRSSWDDAKLRAFFDEGDHVRDLLAVVYDTSDVDPVGHDHPVIGGLFREQNARLAEITTQLDNMLGDWLARKQRSRGTV